MANILVIDDEPSIRSLIRAILEGDGHQVLEATNGRRGLQLYQEQSADLIITDIVMPEMTGLEMISELMTRFAHVKVIAMSGGLQSENALYIARELGARHTFHKPFDTEELRSVVRYVLVH